MKTVKVLGGCVAVVAALMLTVPHVWQGAKADLVRIPYDRPEMVALGKTVYAGHCASCHGLELEGEPNWRQRDASGLLPAPPHDATGHTWHHPDAQLLSMIKDGFVPGVTAPIGYESDMPAFGAVLTDIQIKSVLAYIKTYWPEDALGAQREISLQ